MSKKVNAALKKAYYYFGFKKVVSYDEVEENINILKNNTSDEAVLNKIEGHEAEIKEFCDSVKDDEKFEFPVKFAKGEPRKSWEAHTADFPRDIFKTGAKPVEEVSEEIEPVDEEELVDSIEPVEEEPVEEVSEEIEPVEEESVEETIDEIEPVEEEEFNELESLPPRPAVVKPKISKTKIYINGELLGYCDNPAEFTQEMREKRRNGEISHEMNITYYEDNDEIYIFNDPGRARRPLIIVEDGVPLLKEEHLNKVANGKLKWDD